MSQLTLPLYNSDKGYTCPCCGRFVKTYRRRLNASMAYVLLLLYRGNKGFIHVENYLKEKGCPAPLRADFHKLVYWRFLEKLNEDRADGSPRNGYYKITGQGIMFCEGKITAHEYVLIYNNKFQGWDGEEITIQKALRNKFNYNELMQS